MQNYGAGTLLGKLLQNVGPGQGHYVHIVHHSRPKTNKGHLVQNYGAGTLGKLFQDVGPGQGHYVHIVHQSCPKTNRGHIVKNYGAGPNQGCPKNASNSHIAQDYG